MKTKETIAIIGAPTHIRSLIAKNLSRNDYRVLATSEETEKLISLKGSILSVRSEAGIYIHECARNVSWEADIIILACSKESEEDIAKKIEQFATGKLVISIAVPLYNSDAGKVSSGNVRFAKELQEGLPNSRVVKAFLPSSSLDFTQPRPEIFIVSNNKDTTDPAVNILMAAGFDPVVADALR